MSIQGEIRERIRASLERYISESGYTQKEIAERLGVSQSSVTNWVKGKNSPDANLVMPICNLLNITVGQFYGEEKIRESPSTAEAAPGEDISNMFDKLNDLLVSEGVIKDGDDLTDRQSEILLAVCRIINAAF